MRHGEDEGESPRPTQSKADSHDTNALGDGFPHKFASLAHPSIVQKGGWYYTRIIHVLYHFHTHFIHLG